MIERLKVFVVCGYGCHLRDKKTGHPTPLMPYLDRVAVYINEQNPHLAIFCGGATQQVSALGATEAGTMTDYLDHDQKFPTGKIQTEFVTSRTSFTTYENIRDAANIINFRLNVLARGGQFWPKAEITIFCETQRALKVVLLARHFMGWLVKDVDDLHVETYSWERADPQRELKTTVTTWLAIKFPILARMEGHKKRQLSKNR